MNLLKKCQIMLTMEPPTKQILANKINAMQKESILIG